MPPPPLIHNPPRDADCIFCKIAAQDLPARRVYEDDDVVAFLDIEPLAPGHVVVIPKGHWATLDKVPAEVGAAIGRVLPVLSRAVMAAVSDDGEGEAAWNILQNNGRAAHQAVGHVHFHVIPKPAGGGGGGEEAGLGITWPAKKLDPDVGENLAQRIRGAMG